jgi:GH24 family phage-related lysozyme (muramidase)
MNQEVIDWIKEQLKKHEGTVPWMYLDHDGNLTIGVGHKVVSDDDSLQGGIEKLWKYGSLNSTRKPTTPLRPASAVYRVPGPKMQVVFPLLNQIGLGPACSPAGRTMLSSAGGHQVNPTGGTVAKGPTVVPSSVSTRNQSIQQMVQEARVIQQMDFGDDGLHDAEVYKPYSTFRMTEPAMKAMLDEDFAQMFKYVRWDPSHKFRDIEKFPEEAQKALMDIAFQTGAGGMAKMTDFADAVQKQDWKLAAEKFKVPQADDDRNMDRKNLLLQAAAKSPAKAAK